jgi:hypothetical protein
MVILPLGNYHYVIRLKKKYKKSELLRICKVIKGSYAEIFALQIYNTFIGQSIDVLQEYKMYYSEEYLSIQDFLFWKYYVPNTYFEDIFRGYSESTFIGLFEDYSWCIDEEGDVMTETIFNLLKELDD